MTRKPSKVLEKRARKKRAKPAPKVPTGQLADWPRR